ncbi:hypothetical protein DBV23_15675 [Edwardsiella ictaluri]|uniref:Uncharacterized protein n=1 Tax=Edwardsiella ictaluri (strain 93-146) TaxID=634503 RepID=C5B895_EDWI9|nr:hypothetical protein [Edwardsiella ictaluri]ACR69467.1 hypothetical protein NT01EI_2296 [Edwardsiella ictaluri 93-146]AVZ83513.1 hypothetical protein DBV23_15675 [Edwardsiella ictaluri]EKS7764723.1 hypothetical protein [Edwardsiella ictaluri]EKS7771595.1 hypothetical protein [Edwardsiella ictaluri]EKS7774744.1 hypothetical protein [Edwardsiella ictaluri]
MIKNNDESYNLYIYILSMVRSLPEDKRHAINTIEKQLVDIVDKNHDVGLLAISLFLFERGQDFFREDTYQN